jgi:hypothetical protein
MKKFFDYAARILLNVFYVLVIIFVLGRTQARDPNLTIVIATIGLLYTAVRGVALSQDLLLGEGHGRN